MQICSPPPPDTVRLLYAITVVFTSTNKYTQDSLRECVHLVTRGHFRSRDKDEGHTTGSAKAENQNPMLHGNFATLCFIELELMPIEVLHCWNMNFLSFLAHVTLDPITFIYELDPYPFAMYRINKNEVPTSRLSKVIILQTYRHTPP